MAIVSFMFLNAQNVADGYRRLELSRVTVLRIGYANQPKNNKKQS